MLWLGDGGHGLSVHVFVWPLWLCRHLIVVLQICKRFLREMAQPSRQVCIVITVVPLHTLIDYTYTINIVLASAVIMIIDQWRCFLLQEDQIGLSLLTLDQVMARERTLKLEQQHSIAS